MTEELINALRDHRNQLDRENERLETEKVTLLDKIGQLKRRIASLEDQLRRNGEMV